MTDAPRQPRVLLLEGSDSDADRIQTHLERARLACTVLRATRRGEFEAALAQPDIDLVLAGDARPDFHGLDALDMARVARPLLPVIFVSGVDNEELATEALRHGATDSVPTHDLTRLGVAVTRALTEAPARHPRQRAGWIEDALRQPQRLEALGELTSSVAHDFNNLLMVVLSNVSLLRRLLPKPPAVDARVEQRLSAIVDAVEGGAARVRQLQAFSHRQHLGPRQVDVNAVVLGMRDLLQATLGGSVQLRTDLAADLWPTVADPAQLELVLLGLVTNARDAMEAGGSLRIRTGNLQWQHAPVRPEEPAPGAYAVLSVIDTGCGMGEEVLAKAFEPFFTTKAGGQHSGLGLARVHGFAEQSGGGVRVDTTVGQGTAIHLCLPRAPGAAAPEAR